MDRRILHLAAARGLLSTPQVAFLSALPAGATITEAVRASSRSRLETLRALCELAALGAVAFEAMVPPPRLQAAPLASQRAPSIASTNARLRGVGR